MVIIQPNYVRISSSFVEAEMRVGAARKIIEAGASGKTPWYRPVRKMVRRLYAPTRSWEGKSCGDVQSPLQHDLDVFQQAAGHLRISKSNRDCMGK
jgi:hypothetical protein